VQFLFWNSFLFCFIDFSCKFEEKIRVKKKRNGKKAMHPVTQTSIKQNR